MIRIGVIGVGFIGSEHCKNVSLIDRAELAAVYDVQTERSKAIADSYAAQAATSPEELITDTAIDAVVIASSSDTHRHFLEMSVKAGKAIYCEKPLSVNTTERVALEKAVQGYEERIFVGFSRRFDTQYQVLKQQSAQIGAIEMVHIINRGFVLPSLEYIKRSGGQFYDQCIHFFDLLRWLSMEEVTSLYAQGAALADIRVSECGDVDTSLIHLHLSGGGFASIDSARRTAYGYDERIELHGSKGLIRSPALLAHDVESFTENGKRGSLMPESWFARMQDSFRTAMESFVSSIDDGRPCSPNCIDGFIAQDLAEYATISLQKNTVCNVRSHG